MSQDLVFRLWGIDVNASKTLEHLGVKATETSAALSTLGKVGAAAFVGIGVAALAAVGEGVRLAATFDASMERIHTQAGVAQDKIAGLSDGVLALSGQVGFSPDSLANSLYHVESAFASQGITAENALNIVKTAAEGAKVGNADLIDTTNALTATMASGIVPINDVAGAMGALNAIVGAGDMTMQDLDEALNTGILSVAKGFGATMNDVGGILAVFGDLGIRGADAATQLRMAMQGLAKPVAGGKAELAALGLTMTSLRDDMEKNGVIDAIGMLHDRLVKLKIPQSQWSGILEDIFGKKAGVGLDLLLINYDRLKVKQVEVVKGSKTFSEAWEKTKDQVTTKWDILAARWEALLIKLGNAIIPWLNSTVLPALDRFTDWFTVNGPKIGAAIVRIWNTAQSLGQHISDVVWKINGALDKFWAKVADIAKKVASAFMSAMHATWDAIDGFGHKIRDVLITIKDGVVRFAIAAWNAIFQFGHKIKEVLIDVKNAVVSFAIAAWNAILGFGHKIQDIMVSIKNWIQTAFSDAVSFIVDKWNGLVSAVEGWPGQIASAVSGMWDSIWTGFEGVINHVIDAWNSLSFSVPSVDVGPVHFGGTTVGVPQIPHLAAGGIVTRPTIALIGEAGPEMVSPLPRGYARGSGDSGAGQTINIHVHNAVVGNERELVKTITTAFHRARSHGVGPRFSVGGSPFI